MAAYSVEMPSCSASFSRLGSPQNPSTGFLTDRLESRCIPAGGQAESSRRCAGYTFHCDADRGVTGLIQPEGHPWLDWTQL